MVGSTDLIVLFSYINEFKC